MPGRKWYLVSLVVLVLGGAAAGLFVYTRLQDLTRELPQVLVPGEAELTIHQPGTYTLFLERQSVLNGKVYTPADVSGLRVLLRSDSTGESVALTEPTMRSTYSLGGREGAAIFSFEIAQPGRHSLRARYDNGRAEPQAVLAIGRGFNQKLFATIAGALVLGLGAFVVAVAIAAVTFWKRRRASRSMAPPAPGDVRA